MINMKPNKFVRKIVINHNRGYEYQVLNIPIRVSEIWNDVTHVEITVHADNSLTVKPL